MGKWFGVALLDNGKSGTLFYDDAPQAGDDVVVWHYDETGTPVNVEGKFVQWLSYERRLLTGNN